MLPMDRQELAQAQAVLNNGEAILPEGPVHRGIKGRLEAHLIYLESYQVW